MSCSSDWSALPHHAKDHTLLDTCGSNLVKLLTDALDPLFWFGLVLGLLECWWRLDDGRDYVLTQPGIWGKFLQKGGFQNVSWTGGSTRESEVARLIIGFKQPVKDPRLCQSIPQADSTGAIQPTPIVLSLGEVATAVLASNIEEQSQIYRQERTMKRTLCTRFSVTSSPAQGRGNWELAT